MVNSGYNYDNICNETLDITMNKQQPPAQAEKIRCSNTSSRTKLSMCYELSDKQIMDKKTPDIISRRCIEAKMLPTGNNQMTEWRFLLTNNYANGKQSTKDCLTMLNCI